MATIRWPCDVLRSQNIAADIAPRSLAAPSSVSGVAQVVASDAGIWKVTLGNVLVRDRASVITFRAIANLLEGRLNPILVPLCRAYQPVPAGSVGLYEAVPHSDDAFFGDDTGYVGRVIDVVTVGTWAARAVSGFVAVNYAGTIEPGQHFSVGERLYRVRTFDPDIGAMTFRPPLREAIPSGTNLEFDDPVVRCRLADDAGMDLDLSMRRFAQPSVSFVEDL
jgi:hypothetical protein